MPNPLKAPSTTDERHSLTADASFGHYGEEIRENPCLGGQTPAHPSDSMWAYVRDHEVDPLGRLGSNRCDHLRLCGVRCDVYRHCDSPPRGTHGDDQAGAGSVEDRRRVLTPDISQDLDEAGELLGRRPATRAEADTELERLLLAASPDREADLVRLLYRRNLRQESLLGPAMRELRDARFQQIRI